MKNATVTLTPLGNKIKFRIRGKVICQKMGIEMSKSGTFDKTDCIWKSVFGSQRAVDNFLKKDRVVNMVMPLERLHYDDCDIVV